MADRDGTFLCIRSAGHPLLYLIYESGWYVLGLYTGGDYQPCTLL